MSPTKFANWSGLVESHDTETRTIVSLDDAQLAVRDAIADKRRLRTVGPTHRWAVRASAHGAHVD